MLAVFTIVKMLTEIALLALAGQWVLGLLAGARKEQNFFYQMLRIIGRPFVSAARWIAPKIVLERHLPLVAFLCLLFVWLAATWMKIQTCLQMGMALCK
jgi:membrane-anchored glycerophosphoryl diester phosphodiesterase (GDPDase)